MFKSPDFVSGYNLPRILILLNADHLNILGTTNMDYKSRLYRPTILFSINKTHCRKATNPQKQAHTEINELPMCHNVLDCKPVELYVCIWMILNKLIAHIVLEIRD